MFFSFVAIFFYTSLLFTPANSQLVDESSYTDPQAFRDVIVDYHNRRRAEHDSGSLTWDTRIADGADEYAKMCNWGHSGVPEFGENLAGGFGSVALALNGWSDEQMLYSIEDYETGVPPPGTGHFTQMVWAATTRIGCGRAKCTGLFKNNPTYDAWYIVCRYSIRGNYRGQYLANVRKPVRRADS